MGALECARLLFNSSHAQRAAPNAPFLFERLAMGYEACYSGKTSLSYGNVTLQQLLLGPAYHDVVEGLVTVRTVWRADAPVYPLWFPEKCNHAPRNLTASSSWRSYAATLGLYFLITIPLCVLFFVHRREKLIRLRDFRQVFLTYVTASVGFTIFVINTGMMSGSGSIRLSIYGLFMNTPYICFVYVVKLGQLLFIYYWNLAKVQRRTFETLHLFRRFKFVLGFKFVLACWSVCMLLGASIATLAITTSSALSNPGDRIFSTIRSDWYHIPDKYTVPTSNSTLCACFNRYVLDESEYTEECSSAVITTCVTGSDKSTANAGFCSACLPYATENIELDQCISWFVDFYLSGSCGFFKYTPIPSTVKVGLAADETFGGLLSGIVGFLSICGCIMLAMIYNTKDEFGLLREFIVTAAGWIPALCFVTLILSSSIPSCVPGNDCWFKAVGSYKVDSINNFFYIFATFYYSVVLLGFPVALVYIDKVEKYRGTLVSRKIEEITVSAESPAPNTHSSEFTTELCATLYTKDERELQVEVCIRHQKLRSIYEQFAVQEFTAENITFLEDCSMLLDSTNWRTLPPKRRSASSESTKNAGSTVASLTSPSLKSVRQKWIQSVKYLCQQYIFQGSPMQMNLPYSIRRHLEASVNALTLNHDTGSIFASDEPNEEAVADALAALAKSYVEIRRLIARDSWPRFVCSRLFRRYSELVQEAKGMDIEMERIYAAVDMDQPFLTNTQNPIPTQTPTP